MKIRLDELLLKRKFAGSLKEAQALIGAGVVFVEQTVSDKVGNLHDQNANIIVKRKGQYVSRGGLKLEKGLSFFDIRVKDWTCIDVGASTGGFTDCLLQHEARRIYSVDVAYGLLDWKLRQDPRVVVVERCNARNLTREQIPEKVNLAVVDASFISLTKILPPLLGFFEDNIRILALIKPQFELPKSCVEEGGVVREKRFHDKAVTEISQFCLQLGLNVVGTVQSPILGPKGNKEFLIYLHST
ncbi:MAG: TlyA family RNA methyltransferase [Desulfocapsaceae bacterium]|nr:TlyA family RNA methyltransferase [Desulfocapsaceae bacterium]